MAYEIQMKIDALMRSLSTYRALGLCDLAITTLLEELQGELNEAIGAYYR